MRGTCHLSTTEELLQAEVQLALDLNPGGHEDERARLRVHLVAFLEFEVEQRVRIAVVDPILHALKGSCDLSSTKIGICA